MALSALPSAAELPASTFSSSSASSTDSFMDMPPPMAPENIASFLMGGDTVFVDVRPEDAFHKSHLRGALPLSLPNVLWRRFLRLRETPGSLNRYLLSEALSPLKLLTANTMIVLYDDDTTHLSALGEEAPLRVFAEYFAREKLSVCFIEGGLRAALVPLASQIVVTNFGGLPAMVAPDSDSDSSTSSSSSTSYNTTSRSKKPRGAAELMASTELNWIHGFLAVGSEKHAHDIALLKREGVTHILNLTDNPSLPDAQRTFTTLQVSMRDTLSENLLVHLYKALDFIDSAHAQGGRVLVHCFAGVSRSVSVSVAYAMWRYDLSLEAAMRLVKNHRECASPNLNFVGQLMMFERTLAQTAAPAAPAAAAPAAAAAGPDPAMLQAACATAVAFLQAAIATHG